MSISELAAFLGAEGISGDDKEFKRELEQAKRRDFPHLYERYGSIPTSFIHTPYLPISTPADGVDVWEHETYHGSIILRQGIYTDPETKVRRFNWAAGGVPRYLFATVLSEAIRTDSPKVDLGPSLYSFAKRHDIAKSGKTYKRISEQIQTLFSSPMMYQRSTDYEHAERLQIANIRIASSVDIWVPKAQQNTLEGLEPHVTLSPEMFALIKADTSTPIRLDILSQLINRPLAMDILNWLGFITYSLDQSGAADARAWFEWEHLERHFVHNYKRSDNFRKGFMDALKYIKTVFYPALKFDIIPHPRDRRKTALVIYRSPLLIERKQLSSWG